MKSLQGIRHTLILLAVLGLTGRVFIPAGFMPAPVADGWPIKICSSVLNQDALIFGTRDDAPDLHAHHGHHGHAAHEHPASGEEHAQHNPCPAGAFFASSALVEDGEALVYAPEAIRRAPAVDSYTAESVPVDAPLARGPPSELPLSA